MSTKPATYDGDSESESSVAAFLAEHPRLMGALFTAMLLLSQSGAVAAGEAHTLSGP